MKTNTYHSKTVLFATTDTQSKQNVLYCNYTHNMDYVEYSTNLKEDPTTQVR